MKDIADTGIIPETEIISRIRNGEKALFEILIRRNNPFLYKIARSYGFTHEDAEDLMQEAFVAAYLNLSKFEGRSSFKTWLTRIMLNQCYHKTKSMEAKQRHIEENSAKLPAGDASSDTWRSIANKEISDIIARALVSIPLDYRLVFSLRELNGMNTAETAELLDITETNVKVRLNRAKSMLRQKLEKLYSPEDVFEFNLVYCDRVVDRVMKTIGQGGFPPRDANLG